MATASAPPKTEKTKPEMGLCGAERRSGGTCRNRAGFKTDHVGTGRCHLHSGSTRNGRKHAAAELAIRLGAEIQIEPHDALLLTVRLAAGWERFCRDEVTRLQAAQIVLTPRSEKTEYTPVLTRVGDDLEDTGAVVAERTTNESNAAELNIWVREHQKALDQLARLAKAAIDAGVAERQVRLAEQLVGDIAAVLDRVLAGHGITGAQRKPDVIRGALMLLEGGRAA